MEHHPYNLPPDVVRRILMDSGAPAPGSHPGFHRGDGEGAVLPRPVGPPPGQIARPAAVAVLLYPGLQGLMIALTRRTGHLAKHAGQISFPGGSVDADDTSDLAAALRETREELGIDTADMELWAQLGTVYIPPSNYLVRPYVLYSADRPDFRPNPGEVEAMLEVPLSLLLEPESVESEWWDLPAGRFLVPYFRFGSEKIWGATAAILSELVMRLRAGLA